MKLNTFPIKSGGIHACDTVLLEGVEISSTDRGAAMSMWYTNMNRVKEKEKRRKVRKEKEDIKKATCQDHLRR